MGFAAFLGFALSSGCGGARVMKIPSVNAPSVAQSIQETAPGAGESSSGDASAPVESATDTASPAESPSAAQASGASAPQLEDASVEETPSTSVIVEDYPEDEEEGPAEIVVVAPLQSQVEYRVDGNDPVPAAPSFDLGPVSEGEHAVEVLVTPPVGTPEKFEFKWKQTKRFDPDAHADDRELERRAKRREERKAKREARKAARKAKKKHDREDRRDDRKEDRREEKQDKKADEQKKADEAAPKAAGDAAKKDDSGKGSSSKDDSGKGNSGK